MVDGSNSIEITVTITTRVYFATDENGRKLLSLRPPPTEGPFVSVGFANARGYGDAQLGIMKDVITAIVSAAYDMRVDPRIAIALGIKESRLGTGGQIAGNKAAWKDPNANPLQLSAACKGCPPRARAGVENRDYNIKGALQVFIDLGGSIKRFGGEGVARSQRGYSADFRRYYEAISDTSRSVTFCMYGKCR
jgi:hypothetical protein